MTQIRLAWMAALGLTLGACSGDTNGSPAGEPGPGAEDSGGAGGDADSSGDGATPDDGSSGTGAEPGSSDDPTGGEATGSAGQGGGSTGNDVPDGDSSDGGGADGSNHPAGSWVSYGNGPRNWFNNTAETTLSVDNAANLQEIWRMSEEGQVSAPPAIVDDVVYVTTGQALIALNAEDGSEIWRNPDGASTASPAYDQETGWLFVNGDGASVYAIDTQGNTVWGPQPLSPQNGNNGFSSPAIAGNLIVVGLTSIDRGREFRGGLVAFDKQTGEQAWLYYHVEPPLAGVSVWAGAGTDGTYVYAGSGNNYGTTGDTSDSLFAVDLDGSLQWNQQMTEGDGWAFDNFAGGPDHDFGTNPIIYDMGGRELLAAGQKSGEFHVLDRKTGQIVWQQPLATTTNQANGGILNNGAFDGERFIVAANEGGSPGNMYGLDASPDANGEILWEKPMPGLSWAPITVANGVGFVPAGTKMLVIDTSTGDTLNEIEGGGTVAGAASIADGRVFFGAGLSYIGTQAGQEFIALSVE